MSKNLKTKSSIELFSGAGGLALGLEKAGFDHRFLIEWEPHPCETLRLNGNSLYDSNVRNWKVLQMDVREFDYTKYRDKIDLVAGGPPCQPFSLGGKHRGNLDDRDMFPEAVRSVRELAPKAFIFENVKGLTRPAFAKYFEYIFLQLSHPDVKMRNGETWVHHLSRLENHHTKGSRPGLEYNVVFRVLNAADYGVPQSRSRVVLVGFRNDLGIEWSFPNPTHSYLSLIHSQVETQEYWERHGISKKERKVPIADGFFTRSAFDDSEKEFSLLPWKTVRDAISDLPDPQSIKKSSLFSNHKYIGGAKAYAGHTGSHIDLPSKTIKAGDHGVPGGENMILFSNGKTRYFTAREAARIQTFPDDYVISGSWTESMRQLGNAVPVELARVIGENVMKKLQ